MHYLCILASCMKSVTVMIYGRPTTQEVLKMPLVSVSPIAGKTTMDSDCDNFEETRATEFNAQANVDQFLSVFELFDLRLKDCLCCLM